MTSDPAGARDTLPSRLIAAATTSLRSNVLPFITDEAAQVHVDLITRVLWLASYRLNRHEDDQAALRDREAAVLKDIEAMLGRPEADLPVTDRINHIAAPLLNEAISNDQAQALLEQLVSLECDALVAQDPDIVGGSAVVFRGGRIESERGAPSDTTPKIPVSASTLAPYFQTQWADPSIDVENVRVIAGGFSKTTIFFDILRHETAEPVVMRKDMPYPFMDKAVADEFPLLRRLYNAGFPVAEPLLIETDRSAFGSPFLLSRQVAGTCDFRRWASDPVSVRQFSMQLAELMARLHQLDLAALGYDAAEARKSAGQLMREELERWEKLFIQIRSRPHPLTEIALTWLRHNIPADAFDRPGRIVHGDIGFHNLLFNNGAVTAVLDWEFSHLGDPLEDLVYTKIFIEQIMDWDEFKGFYVDNGGLICPKSAELFYGIWSRIRNAIGSLDGAYLFDTHLPEEIKFAVSGHVFAPYLEMEACEMIMASLNHRL